MPAKPNSSPLAVLLERQKDWQEKVRTLRPIRQMIVTRYLEIKTTDRRTDFQVIKVLANSLGYKLDRNGTNNFLVRVIEEFFAS